MEARIDTRKDSRRARRYYPHAPTEWQQDLKTIPAGKGFSSMTANMTIDGTSIDVKKLSKSLQARINAKDLREDDD